MKTKSIFLFAIITLLLVFSGCSEKAEMPTEPNIEMGVIKLGSTENEFLISGSEIADIIECDGKYYIVEKGQTCADIDFSEYQLINEPSYAHYLKILRELFDYEVMNQFFKSPNMVNAYRNKLDVLIKMVEDGNYKASYNKGLHDFYNITHKWIDNPVLLQVIDAFLYFTGWMIENQEFLYEPTAIIKEGKGTFTRELQGKMYMICKRDYLMIFGAVIWEKIYDCQPDVDQTP